MLTGNWLHDAAAHRYWPCESRVDHSFLIRVMCSWYKVKANGIWCKVICMICSPRWRLLLIWLAFEDFLVHGGFPWYSRMKLGVQIGVGRLLIPGAFWTSFWASFEVFLVYKGNLFPTQS